MRRKEKLGDKREGVGERDKGERVAGRGGGINKQDVNSCTQSPNSGSG